MTPGPYFSNFSHFTIRSFHPGWLRPYCNGSATPLLPAKRK